MSNFCHFKSYRDKYIFHTFDRVLKQLEITMDDLEYMVAYTHELDNERSDMRHSNHYKLNSYTHFFKSSSHMLTA